ncbi:unnamed protein product, partial [marine sediment metagenome]
MAYARGLIPIRSAAGGYDGALETFEVAADYGTAVVVGDPVILLAAGSDGVVGMESAVADGVYPEVQAAAAGGVIYGVVTSIEPIYSDLSKTYIPASTGGRV